MKTCTKCNQPLPLAAFQRNRSRPDGLQSYCRECMNLANRMSSAKNIDAKRARTAKYDREHAEERRAYRATWRKANAERIKARNAEYRAANKERIDSYNAEYNERTRDRRKAEYAANPEPAKQRARAWQLKNPNKVLERNRRWREANPERYREYMRLGTARRRARQANLPTFTVTTEDLRRIAARPCAVDGCTNTDIQVDHVIPIARGGAHGIGNLQPLCASHNAAKCARLWIEFRVYLSMKQQFAA